MDEGELPGAAELGVSEAEYARILRRLPGRAPEAAPTGSRPAPLLLLATALAVLLAVAAVRAASPSVSGGEPAYAFLQYNTADQPVTYTSCRPIQVAVYPAGGPPDAEALVEEAVGRIRSATGLDLVIVGSFGGHAPNWNFEAAPVSPADPISVSWQTSEAIANLTDHTAGLGGSRTVTNPDGTKRYVAGTIVLSSDFYRELADRGDHDQALAVLLHEFGHVVGLGHVDAPGELMHEDNLGRTTFGPGDLEGLRRLGQGPCV